MIENEKINRNKRVLCVDLDGTLIKTDLLMECLIRLLKKNFLYLFVVPIWLLLGIKKFKQKVAESIDIKDIKIPLNDDVVKFLNEELSKRKIYLVTGAHQSLAEIIGNQFKIFSEIHGTNESINLTGKNKAKFLVDLLGKNNFDYIGNSTVDKHVFNVAHDSYLVGHQNILPNQKFVKIFSFENDKLKSIFKSMRYQQWVKNLLVFLPLLLAQRWSNLNDVLYAFFSFLLFSAIASCVYLFNDFIDLDTDREHPSKKKRPLASADLTILTGLKVFIGLSLASFILSLIFFKHLIGILAIYIILNFLYSKYLKKIAIADIFLLASFYILRIFYGAFALDIPISPWFFSFSFFFFLSLAFLKRFSEIKLVFKNSGESLLKGRDYEINDSQFLAIFGILSGGLSTLIYSLYLYIGQHNHLYKNISWLWGQKILLLYWLAHIWLKAYRGKVKDDPVRFALKDKTSLILGCILIIFYILAI